MNDAEQDALPLSADEDAEIGREMLISLFNLVDECAEQRSLDRKTAADYLLCGSLFVVADILDISLEDMPEFVETMVASLLEPGSGSDSLH